MKRSHEVDTEETGKVRILDNSLSSSSLPLCSNTFNKSLAEDLRSFAMEIDKTDTAINGIAYNKLSVISEQMMFLSQQAQNIFKKHQQDKKLHHAACNFTKVPGHIYHLYLRPSGQLYFSMISPQEWNIPHEYSGSYRLEHDQSWTDVSQIDERRSKLEEFEKMICKFSQHMN